MSDFHAISQLYPDRSKPLPKALPPPQNPSVWTIAQGVVWGLVMFCAAAPLIYWFVAAIADHMISPPPPRRAV